MVLAKAAEYETISFSFQRNDILNPNIGKNNNKNSYQMR